MALEPATSVGVVQFSLVEVAQHEDDIHVQCRVACWPEVAVRMEGKLKVGIEVKLYGMKVGSFQEKVTLSFSSQTRCEVSEAPAAVAVTNIDISSVLGITASSACLLDVASVKPFLHFMEQSEQDDKPYVMKCRINELEDRSYLACVHCKSKVQESFGSSGATLCDNCKKTDKPVQTTYVTMQLCGAPDGELKSIGAVAFGETAKAIQACPAELLRDSEVFVRARVIVKDNGSFEGVVQQFSTPE